MEQKLEIKIRISKGVTPMTENQFYAWLLFALPVLVCFSNPQVPFQYQLMLALIVSILPIGLFFLGENEFIKDCKKGYTDWSESILPQRIYKRYQDEEEIN